MENIKEETISKLNFLEQQIYQIHQQIEIISRNISELGIIKNDLDEIKKSKDSETLSPIGKGIFVKTKIISEELVVDVGQGILLKKDIDSTKKLIGEQINKLKKSQEELEEMLKQIEKEFSSIFLEMKKEK